MQFSNLMTCEPLSTLKNNWGTHIAFSARVIVIDTVWENKVDKCLKMYYLKIAIVNLLHSNVSNIYEYVFPKN